jgi:hypothetical protein
VCDSVLLEESLKIFLSSYIESYKKSDFVITDKKLDIDKPQFIISHHGAADLHPPFGQSTLIRSLEKFYASITQDGPITSLEVQVEELLKEYTTKLMNLVKAHA